MSIIKNDVPILEYDDAQSAVFMPTHENLGITLPKKAVFAFLGDTVDNYALTPLESQVLARPQ